MMKEREVRGQEDWSIEEYSLEQREEEGGEIRSADGRRGEGRRLLKTKSSEGEAKQVEEGQGPIKISKNKQEKTHKTREPPTLEEKMR